MQPVQIAMSGVTPGTYGNSKQIPTFTVDIRGRLVFAANVDIEPELNVVLNGNLGQNVKCNLNHESLKIQSGQGISVRKTEDNSLEFSLDTNLVQNMINVSTANREPVNRNISSVSGSTLVNTYTGTIHGLIESTNAFFDARNTFENNVPGITVVSNSTREGLLIKGPGDTMLYGPHITLVSHNKNNDFRELKSVNVGDSLGQIRFATEVGEDQKNAPSSIITSVLESIGDNVTTFNKSDIRFILLDGGNIDGIYQAKFSRQTGLTAPVITPGSYSDASERDRKLNNPVPGMMIYLESTHKFQGYVGGNSSGWIDLH